MHYDGGTKLNKLRILPCANRRIDVITIDDLGFDVTVKFCVLIGIPTCYVPVFIASSEVRHDFVNQFDAHLVIHYVTATNSASKKNAIHAHFTIPILNPTQ